MNCLPTYSCSHFARNISCNNYVRVPICSVEYPVQALTTVGYPPPMIGWGFAQSHKRTKTKPVPHRGQFTNNRKSCISECKPPRYTLNRQWLSRWRCPWVECSVDIQQMWISRHLPYCWLDIVRNSHELPFNTPSVLSETRIVITHYILPLFPIDAPRVGNIVDGVGRPAACCLWFMEFAARSLRYVHPFLMHVQ